MAYFTAVEKRTEKYMYFLWSQIDFLLLENELFLKSDKAMKISQQAVKLPDSCPFMH